MAGGVVGDNSGNSTITSCYFLTGTAEKGIGGGSGSAAETSSLTDIPIGNDGLPAEDWMMSASLGRPILISNPEGVTLVGDGTSEGTAFQIPQPPHSGIFPGENQQWGNLRGWRGQQVLRRGVL